MASDRRTPGIPGVFGDLQWVDSPDYGEAPENRRVPRTYDVDPAPLARLIAAYLHLNNGDLSAAMGEVAGDDRDGPIHIVHLLAACEHAAMQTGGGMPGSSGFTGDAGTRLISSAVSGEALPALVDALRSGGFPAATQLARSMDSGIRHRVLDSLLQYWGAAIIGLQMDLTDDKFRQKN
jgi:hypothetical protein